MWYAPENFFDLEPLKGAVVQPLLEVAKVWDILDELEPFIRRTLRGNAAEMRRDGDMTMLAWGLLGGRAYRGVTYELGDPLKGRLKVYHEGIHLPGAALIMPGVALCGDDIEIGEGAVVESGALIKGPTIIGPRSEVRQGAYVRGGVMSCPGAVIGHATEAKNTLLLDGAKAGHFAYLGDSILGREVNLGAGTKLANLKMNSTPYVFRVDGQKYKVERRKFGAVIGDHTETGCNTVTNPGTLLGRQTKVLPNTSVAPGYHSGRAFLGGR